MLFIAFLTVLLSVFWVLLSWHFTPFMCGCGVVSIALSMYLSVRMRVVDAESQPLHMPIRIVGYWMWLAKEVALSTWDVTRHIWSPALHISPRMMQVECPPETPFGVMLYANSMTLTPGTVCLDVAAGHITAHALTESAAAGLEAGEMGKRIHELGL